MRCIAAALVLVAGCVSPARSDAPAAADRVVEGTVVRVDMDPWAYDGNAVLELATDDGAVTVEVPARTNLCQASGLGLVGELAAGDRVRVRGAEQSSGVVVPCVSDQHALERLAP